MKIGGMSIFNLGVKLMTGIALTKLIASFYGTIGMAHYGQLINIVALLGTISVVGLHVGVVNRLAKSLSSQEQIEIISTVLAVIVVVWIIISVFLLVFIDTLSNDLFDRNDFGDVVVLTIFAILFYGLQLLSQAVLTGLGMTKELFLSMLTQSLFPLFTIALLTPFEGNKLLLYGAVLGGILASLYTFTEICKHYKLSPKALISNGSIQILKSLVPFIVMVLVSSVCQHGVLILIRTALMDELSPHYAGIWNGMLRISDIALTTAATVFSVYYLPKVSSISQPQILRREMIAIGVSVLPVTLITLTIIYFSKESIIRLVFSEHFQEINQLFLFQLMGDFFRISSWVFSYLLLAKLKVRYFLISESLFAILFYVTTKVLLREYGFSILSLTYLLSSICYFAMVFWFVYKGIFYGNNKDISIA